jgi:hypothetical protein
LLGKVDAEELRLRLEGIRLEVRTWIPATDGYVRCLQSGQEMNRQQFDQHNRLQRPGLPVIHFIPTDF